MRTAHCLSCLSRTATQQHQPGASKRHRARECARGRRQERAAAKRELGGGRGRERGRRHLVEADAHAEHAVLLDDDARVAHACGIGAGRRPRQPKAGDLRAHRGGEQRRARWRSGGPQASAPAAARAKDRGARSRAAHHLSAGELWQVVLALRVCAVTHQQLARTERVGHHDGDGRRAAARADLLDNLRVPVRREALAAVLLRTARRRRGARTVSHSIRPMLAIGGRRGRATA